MNFKTYIIFAVSIVFALIAYVTYEFQTFQTPKFKHDLPDDLNQISQLPEFNNLEIAERYGKGLSFRTISRTNEEEFEKFLAYLVEEFPLFHENVETKHFPFGLMYVMEGEDKRLDEEPIVFLSHIDVVPVPETDLDQWDSPPFDGKVIYVKEEDKKYIYGRGAVDDKIGVIGMLQAVELLLGRTESFKPKRKIYFCFGLDEEVIRFNDGAKNMSKYLRDIGIKPYFMMDEGGIITRNTLKDMGVNNDVAVIALSEKGIMNVNITIDCKGGHSSMPNQGKECIDQLSEIVQNFARNPKKGFPRQFIVPFINHVFPNSKFAVRLFSSVARRFDWLVDLLFSRDKKVNAALRTTFAVTMFQAGHTENVLPNTGWIVMSVRIHPSDTKESVLNFIKKAVGRDNAKIDVYAYRKTDKIAETDCKQYETLARTIKVIYDDVDEVIVSPYLMTGGSDLIFYRDLTPYAYNFMPVVYNKELNDISRLHGINERLGVKDYANAVDFYMLLNINLQKL